MISLIAEEQTTDQLLTGLGHCPVRFLHGFTLTGVAILVRTLVTFLGLQFLHNAFLAFDYNNPLLRHKAILLERRIA